MECSLGTSPETSTFPLVFRTMIIGQTPNKSTVNALNGIQSPAPAAAHDTFLSMSKDFTNAFQFREIERRVGANIVHKGQFRGNLRIVGQISNSREEAGTDRVLPITRRRARRGNPQIPLPAKRNHEDIHPEFGCVAGVVVREFERRLSEAPRGCSSRRKACCDRRAASPSRSGSPSGPRCTNTRSSCRARPSHATCSCSDSRSRRGASPSCGSCPGRGGASSGSRRSFRSRCSFPSSAEVDPGCHQSAG